MPNRFWVGRSLGCRQPKDWRGLLLAAVLSIVLVVLTACNDYQAGGPPGLANILDNGKITLITRNDAHCYYIYRDQAMGFEYDLAKALADELGVTLEVKVIESWPTMVAALHEGRGDFIAANINITPGRRRQVAFSRGYLQIQPVIITRRDNNNIQMLFDLDGQTVYVRAGSPYLNLLKNLQARGIAVKIHAYTDMVSEELIRRVAQGKIDITVANSNIALLNRRYYPQTVLAGPLAPPVSLGWAVDPRAQKLLNRINQFFAKIKANGHFTAIYNRYYTGVEDFDYVDLKTYHRRLKTRLPPFVDYIQKAAHKYGFDWRLIAAQIYQESHFFPHAQSADGASGLMQLTEKTADKMGIDDLFDPAQNIEAGVRYLKKLYDLYDECGKNDRIFLALAAYNVGQGHINDARRLAQKLGHDPNRWASLKITLPLLRNRQYYLHSTYGYCRGTEPIRYIKRIIGYYDILKRQAISYEADAPPDIS